mgnify:CR=1 FL=1
MVDIYRKRNSVTVLLLLTVSLALYGSVDCFFFLMIRRPPRSTLDRSSAASDVYKRQVPGRAQPTQEQDQGDEDPARAPARPRAAKAGTAAVSYTHLRAHETVLDLVCRLLLEKKNNQN